MANDYIPRRDGDFKLWIDNYSELLSAAPTDYGLSSADTDALATMTSTFNNTLATATNGTTRTSGAIAAKDKARANVETRARQLAILIQATMIVTLQQKIELRLTARKTNKTPIPAPTSSPLLKYIGTTTRQHTLRFSDQNTPNAKVKPFGVAMLQLSVWIAGLGSTPEGPPAQILSVTRNPFAVDFSPEDLGKQATYVGRWITLKGLLGPESASLSAVIG